MPTLEDIIRRFALSPLNGEGGLFRRTYASTDVLSAKSYGERYAENTKKEAARWAAFRFCTFCILRTWAFPP